MRSEIVCGGAFANQRYKIRNWFDNAVFLQEKKEPKRTDRLDLLQQA